VDLEKTCDTVAREVICWTMHKLGAGEWLVLAVMTVYVDARTMVRTVCGNTGGEVFSLEVARHQGSGLRPLLFATVMEAISREFWLVCLGYFCTQKI